MPPDIDSQISDFIFDSNLSIREIAKEVGISEAAIRERIQVLGLGWVRRNKGHASRGQAALTSILRKLLPGEKVVTEEPIGDRLRLDVYCPKYKLALEYHGRQHFEYVEHFHGDIDGFRLSQERDDKKQRICDNLGIVLVVVRYNDELTEAAIFDRIIEALRSTPAMAEPKKPSIKGNPHYEQWKQRQRQYRQAAYRKMKRER